MAASVRIHHNPSAGIRYRMEHWHSINVTDDIFTSNRDDWMMVGSEANVTFVINPEKLNKMVKAKVNLKIHPELFEVTKNEDTNFLLYGSFRRSDSFPEPNYPGAEELVESIVLPAGQDILSQDISNFMLSFPGSRFAQGCPHFKILFQVRRASDFCISRDQGTEQKYVESILSSELRKHYIEVGIGSTYRRSESALLDPTISDYTDPNNNYDGPEGRYERHVERIRRVLNDPRNF